MRRRALLCALLLALTLDTGCKQPASESSLVSQARFGVFYGGQIQEREEIPFELDRTKQMHGFYLQFARPLPHELKVKYEINKPGSSSRVRDHKGRVGKGRLVQLGEAVVPAGRERFDQSLPFEPGDPLGTWNIRVTVQERIVIDRPFLVYDAAKRRAQQQDAGR